MNASVTDGPARSAIAAAVRTNSPAPMIAPIPSATSAQGPSVRLSEPSPVSRESARSDSIDLVRNKPATRVLVSFQASALQAPAAIERASMERPVRDGMNGSRGSGLMDGEDGRNYTRTLEARPNADRALKRAGIARHARTRR